MREVQIGTRGSQLALRQARWVAEQLRESGHQASIQIIRTTGDRAASVPLSALGPREGVKGVFTKEIEDALLAGEIDVAVHSLKDLPTALDPRLELGCIPRRADPRDALVGRTVAELESGGRVGTGSRRRAAQIRALLPNVTVAQIRGNVDTRIRKLRAGKYDAIVLAAAGLERLGLLAEVAEYLGTDRMVPAVGQGALGIEIRAGDDRVSKAVAPLHDPDAAAEVLAERILLRELGGGCDMPLGANGSVAGYRLTLIAAAEARGGGMVSARGVAPAAEAADLGLEVASRLIRRGVPVAR